MKLDRIEYTDDNRQPHWEKNWFSAGFKYEPMTDFSDFQCIEEVTVWDKSEFTIPSHTYVLNRAGYCNGYFMNNIINLDNWVQFGRSNKGFTKSHRKFKKVNIGNLGENI